MVSRFECLRFLVGIVGDALVTMSVSGMTIEWHHLRPEPPSLRLGMGFTTPVALGLALALPHRPVVALDTDGGMLMNLGILAVLGNTRPVNLKVFVMDNECYESVGGFPTATAGATDLAAMAKVAGIKNAATTRTLDEFKQVAQHAMTDNALHFVVAKIEKGVKKLPPFDPDGIESKYKFARYIEETEKIQLIGMPLQQIPKDLLR